MFLLVFVAVIVYIIIDGSNNNRDRGYNEYQEKSPSHDEGELKNWRRQRSQELTKSLNKKIVGSTKMWKK